MTEKSKTASKEALPRSQQACRHITTSTPLECNERPVATPKGPPYKLK